MASDCLEGNRREYSISGNQTLCKEEEVQYVLILISIYIIYLISHIYLIIRDLSLPFFCRPTV